MPESASPRNWGRENESIYDNNATYNLYPGSYRGVTREESELLSERGAGGLGHGDYPNEEDTRQMVQRAFEGGDASE